jgi:hypothetical protein
MYVCVSECACLGKYLYMRYVGAVVKVTLLGRKYEDDKSERQNLSTTY